MSGNEDGRCDMTSDDIRKRGIETDAMLGALGEPRISIDSACIFDHANAKWSKWCKTHDSLFETCQFRRIAALEGELKAVTANRDANLELMDVYHHEKRRAEQKVKRLRKALERMVDLFGSVGAHSCAAKDGNSDCMTPVKDSEACETLEGARTVLGITEGRLPDGPNDPDFPDMVHEGDK
jgi:hypothetical protein